jgi:simple sugar transport system permease protein
LALAFGVGALVAQLSGLSPGPVYRELIRGAFGDQYRIFQTLTQATPIMFTSLSFLIAFRAGLFNIGAEGQLYLGRVFRGLGRAFTLVLPPYFHTVSGLCLWAPWLERFGALSPAGFAPAAEQTNSSPP